MNTPGVMTTLVAQRQIVDDVRARTIVIGNGSCLKSGGLIIRDDANAGKFAKGCDYIATVNTSPDSSPSR